MADIRSHSLSQDWLTKKFLRNSFSAILATLRSIPLPIRLSQRKERKASKTMQSLCLEPPRSMVDSNPEYTPQQDYPTPEPRPRLPTPESNRSVGAVRDVSSSNLASNGETATTAIPAPTTVTVTPSSTSGVDPWQQWRRVGNDSPGTHAEGSATDRTPGQCSHGQASTETSRWSGDGGSKGVGGGSTAGGGDPPRSAWSGWLPPGVWAPSICGPGLGVQTWAYCTEYDARSDMCRCGTWYKGGNGECDNPWCPYRTTG